MRVKITTPVTDHNGAVGNVTITQGVGFADTEAHVAEIAYCRANGYTVENVEVVELRQTRVDLGFTADDIADMEAEDQAPEVPMPRRNGSVEAWRAYAIDARGMSPEEANALSRDQLVERFTSTEEDQP